MSHVLRRYFDRLDAYDAPFVTERLLHDGSFTDPQELRACFTELKKYVSLSRIHQVPLAMTSPRVDEVWHQFILFTREYRDFCAEFHGGFFHHAPNLPSRPGNPKHIENLVRCYQATYGPMPAVWNICEHHQGEVRR
jgi:hypothetical protein